MSALKVRECCRENFLFSNVEPWQLYSPQNRHSKCVSVFYIVWLWLWTLMFTAFIIVSGAQDQAWYTDESDRVKWFIYLTNWGFTVFCTGLLVRSVTATYCFIHKVNRVTWYMKLNWFLYEMSLPEAVLISILFYALIYSSEYPMEDDTVFSHGVNGAFVLIDFWITAMPIRILHIYVPTLFIVCFVIFSAIYDMLGGTNAVGSPYIYSVLDWSGSTTTTGVFAAGCLVGILVLHCILFGLCKLRQLLYNKCQSSLVVTTSTGENDVEVVEVGNITQRT